IDVDVIEGSGEALRRSPLIGADREDRVGAYRARRRNQDAVQIKERLAAGSDGGDVVPVRGVVLNRDGNRIVRAVDDRNRLLKAPLIEPKSPAGVFDDDGMVGAAAKQSPPVAGAVAGADRTIKPLEPRGSRPVSAGQKKRSRAGGRDLHSRADI